MSDAVQLLKRDAGVVELTLHRPEALNALNVEVLLALKTTLEQIAADPTVRVVVLRGAGEKALVAGADIREMQSMGRTDAAQFSRLGHAVCLLLESMPAVTVAAVHGFALGGGTELALACDFILASEKAQFGLPEVGLGVIPGFGGTIRLARIIGLSRAKELLLSGERIGAEEAARLGLIRRVLPQEGFFDAVQKFAERIARNSRTAVAAAKSLMNEFEESVGFTPRWTPIQGFGLLEARPERRHDRLH